MCFLTSTDNSPARDLNVFPVLAQLPPKISMVYISLQGYSYIFMGQHVATAGLGVGGGIQCFPHKISQYRKAKKTRKIYFLKCSFLKPRLLDGHS